MPNNSEAKKNSSNSASSYDYSQSQTFRSSSSFDSKNNESGIGNSIGMTSSQNPEHAAYGYHNLHYNHQHGTSSAAAAMANQRKFTVKKVELLNELKSLLKLKGGGGSGGGSSGGSSSTNNNATSSSKNNNNNNSGASCSQFSSSNTDDTNMIEGYSGFNRTQPQQLPVSSRKAHQYHPQQQTESEIDMVMLKAIQYIKLLEKNQIKKRKFTGFMRLIHVF